jgi:prepilin-type N-terminal cleavage/methylation domain-containing protein
MVLSGRDAGFSLVELMVVLAIAGLAASAVVLSFSRGDGLARSEGQRLAARLGAARDAAVIGGQPMAVDVDPLGYAFRAGRAVSGPGRGGFVAGKGLACGAGDPARWGAGPSPGDLRWHGHGQRGDDHPACAAGARIRQSGSGGVAVVLARDGEVSLSGDSAP